MNALKTTTDKVSLDITLTDFRAYISREGSTAIVKALRNDPESPWHASVWVNNGETYCYGRKFKTTSGLTKWAEKEI